MKKWILGSKLEYYDVFGAFAEDGFIDWGVSSNMAVGDVVYIYVGVPVKKLLFKSIVTGIDLGDMEEDEKFQEENYENIKEKDHYARLELQECYLGNKMKYLTYEKLRENGLNGAVQGKGIILNNNPKLKDYIEMVEA